MIVLSASMVKSGSAWYFNMTNDLLVAAGQPDIRRLRDQYALGDLLLHENCLIMDLTEPNLVRLDAPRADGHTYVVKTHAGPWPAVKSRLAERTLLATYIYRDPRDVALSAFEHGQVERQGGAGGAFAHLDSLETAIRWVGEWPLQVWQKWSMAEGTLPVRYEALLADPAGELRRLAAFLSLTVPAADLDTIVTRYAKPEPYGRLHFNKGVSQRFRTSMTASQRALCRQAFGSSLAAMGYAD